MCVPLALLAENEFALIFGQLYRTTFLFPSYIKQLHQQLHHFLSIPQKSFYTSTPLWAPSKFYRIMEKKIRKWARWTYSTIFILSLIWSWKSSQGDFSETHSKIFSRENGIQQLELNKFSSGRQKNPLVYFQVQTRLCKLMQHPWKWMFTNDWE